MATKRFSIKGKEVWFIERERYVAFIAEHEVLFIPKNKLPIQVKQYSDGTKATTLDPNWTDIEPFRKIESSIWTDYLEPHHYFKQEYMGK